MDLIVANLRLAELVAIVRANRDFFEDFLRHLHEGGYAGPRAFAEEPSDEKATAVIASFLRRASGAKLFDGLGRPYKNALARWYFLSWFFRDAPAQRLASLVSESPGDTLLERRANLLNELRGFVAPLFPDDESWSWAAISEVMLQRLEGSRRALKGTLFEAIVRRGLKAVFDRNHIKLKINPKEVRIHDETYDVQISGPTRSMLIPVKTRETTGGGHAMLFTRDIDKAITVAENDGYRCLPVVIAESWGGKLGKLKSERFIHIKANPNQVTAIEPMLLEKLRELIGVFQDLADH